jgi:hypothetical protein
VQWKHGGRTAAQIWSRGAETGKSGRGNEKSNMHKSKGMQKNKNEFRGL